MIQRHRATRHLGLIGIFMVVSTIPLAAAHAAPNAIRSHLSAYLVEQGGHLAPIHGMVRRGQEIEYIATYANDSRVPISGLRATLPIPSGLRLVSATERPTPKASADGKHYAPLPLMRTVRRHGTTRRVRVPLANYRDLRWNLGTLTAGQRRSVSAIFRVGN